MTDYNPLFIMVVCNINKNKKMPDVALAPTSPKLGLYCLILKLILIQLPTHNIYN